MKTHLNFSTTNLAKSIAFYSTLLDAHPAKLREDYALFITEKPGLELALDLAGKVTPSSDVHYGIFVDSSQDVERAGERLRSSGFAAPIERAQTCCYANQTKVWVTDPDGRRWEVYTVHGETEQRGGGAACCAEPLDPACCSLS